VLEYLDPGRIEEKVISNYRDNVLLRDTVNVMRNANVAYFLLKLFQSNIYCLELLKNSGGFAVVEDWAGSKAYENQVILSIEEDYPETIRICLELIDKKGSKFSWASNSTEGIVRLE
jgi:hypothetical protein